MKRVTQAELDAATARLQGVMAMEVEERVWGRMMERQKWRVRFQEAAHHFNIRKWRVMWDGCIDSCA
jgi:hypothetical protein